MRRRAGAVRVSIVGGSVGRNRPGATGASVRAAARKSRESRPAEGRDRFILGVGSPKEIPKAHDSGAVSRMFNSDPATGDRLVAILPFVSICIKRNGTYKAA